MRLPAIQERLARLQWGRREGARREERNERSLGSAVRAGFSAARRLEKVLRYRYVQQAVWWRRSVKVGRAAASSLVGIP